MVALAVGSASNIILDYVFMYPLNMGIAGAALATAVGPVFSVLILLPHFLLKKGKLHFAKTHIRFDPIKHILILGFPAFIMELTIGIVTFVYNFAIVKHGYGEIGLAAYLIIGYLMLIILTLFLGMAEGLQPVFSYFAGVGEENRSREMRRFAVKVFLGIGILCYLLIVLFSRSFYSIFSPHDPELIAFAAGRSIPYFCGFFLAGYNILMISYWQSMQKTKSALTVSLSRSIVWPAILTSLLPLAFGNEVIWLCHSLSEGITACTAFILLKRRG